MANVGKPKRTIIVEPLEDTPPVKEPVSPQKAPEKEPEKTPA